MRPRTRPRRARAPRRRGSTGPADDPTRGPGGRAAPGRPSWSPRTLAPAKPSRGRASRRGIRVRPPRPREAEASRTMGLPHRPRRGRRARRRARSSSCRARINSIIERFTPAADYTGTGTGEVVFMIHEGDTGSDISQNLVDEGVTASYDAFYDLLLAGEPRARVPPRRLPARRGDERAVGARRPARPREQAREHLRHPRGHLPARRARRDLARAPASRSRSSRPPPPTARELRPARGGDDASRAACSRRRTRSIPASTRTACSRRSSTASSSRSTAPAFRPTSAGRRSSSRRSCSARRVRTSTTSTRSRACSRTASTRA